MGEQAPLALPEAASREPDPAPSLLALMVWISPAFPVGAYAYSHGLEWAAESRKVGDAATLLAWLDDLLRHGGPRNDLILAASAYRTWSSTPCPPDEASVAEINALALALAGSRERRLETSAQGNAFVAAARAAWPCAALDRLVAVVAGDIAYPVAFAFAAAGHAMPLRQTLEAMLLGLVGNLVSAAQRLGCIGQTDAQRIIAQLLPLVGASAEQAAHATLADLGGAAFQSDLAALQHETQYSRLFRS